VVVKVKTIACMGNAAKSAVASSGWGGSENVRVSTSNTRETWTETPYGAIVQNSDSGTASSFAVSGPMRARYPKPSDPPGAAMAGGDSKAPDPRLSALRTLLLFMATPFSFSNGPLMAFS
jgi:hypothetical protein